MNPIDPQVKSTIDNLSIVDTHEHLEPEDIRTARKTDFFDLFFYHYSSTDAVTSGLTVEGLAKLHDNSVGVDDKWNLIRDNWPYAKLTGFGRSLQKGARDLYGIEDINDRTYHQLHEAFLENNRMGWYEKVLKEKSRIEVSIQDLGPRTDDSRYFVNVDRLDRFISVRCIEDLQNLKNYGGRDVQTVDDLERAMNEYFEAALRRRVVGIKCTLAYMQPLAFPEATKTQAQEDLELIKKTSFPFSMMGLVPHGKKDRHLVNYLIRKALKLVEGAKLPVTFHTGYMEGLGNFIENANARLMTPLIREFPNVRFVLYHANYPFYREAGILAKTYKNVWVDMCFLHVLSREAYRRVLSEYLEVVSPLKVFGFGADYKFVEGTYAQQAFVREDVAQVLSEKIDQGFYSGEEACFVARRILRENALEFYGIKQ